MASMEIQGLLKQHKSGYGWFFWIAALSIVNSAIVLAGAELSFIIGLGLTQLIDGISMGVVEEIGADSKTVVSTIAFILDVIVAGSFAMWGVFAKKGFRWAYVVGMVLYAFDGLIFLLVMDVMSIGFHIFALVCLFKGFKACGELKKLKDQTEKGGSLMDVVSPPPVSTQSMS